MSNKKFILLQSALQPWLGFGLLNCLWAFSAGRFYRVPLPAARQTPNLEENQDLECSNFRHKRPPASGATLANPAAEGGTVGEKWPRILPNVATSTSLLGSLTCRKARHGTDGFTSPPKEGVLRIFWPKNPTASAWFEPANLGTKGQHATSSPPKPLNSALFGERTLTLLKNVRYNNKNFYSLFISGSGLRSSSITQWKYMWCKIS
jgi:hypothetical protein